MSKISSNFFIVIGIIKNQILFLREKYIVHITKAKSKIKHSSSC